MPHDFFKKNKGLKPFFFSKLAKSFCSNVTHYEWIFISHEKSPFYPFELFYPLLMNQRKKERGDFFSLLDSCNIMKEPFPDVHLAQMFLEVPGLDPATARSRPSFGLFIFIACLAKLMNQSRHT